MGEKKTVLIVDDHPFFRKGLKSILAKQSSYQVVGEAGNGEEGLRKAKKLRPDLVIMDIGLPDVSGIEVTRDIREILVETRVVILSMHLKIDYIIKAFRAGATGYVTKESATDRLVKCLESVLKGEYFMDQSLAHEVVENLMKSDNQKAKVSDKSYDTLTRREKEIMCLLAEGLSTKEIAEKLFISRKTVENHRSNIFSKLDLNSTVELIRYAAKFGLIDVTQWRE
jgi:DNA-binding NarL/FixJ family response regulator